MSLNLSIFISTVLLLNCCCNGFLDIKDLKTNTKNVHPEEKFAKFWIKNAQSTVREHLAKQENRKVAKNVILFLGDGMSLPTVTASRIYKGQLKNERGEDSKLFFETFPYVGLSKTYCVDRQVADSACSATAYLCGVKANFGTIGVTASVNLHHCNESMMEENHVSSIAAWAQRAGKGTGIVTTTGVTHASPAGNYAHTASRNYESDSDVSRLYKGEGYCEDIATQLIKREPGKNFNVILGGGRDKFLPKSESGERLDGQNLINEWKERMQNASTKYEYVHDKKTLESVRKDTEYLLGLFGPSYMSYHLDADSKVEPTLSEMTETAINVLKKNENGYFLFVEGGKIDKGHHGNRAHIALDETVEFDKAIELAAKLTSREDTLIVVTADHSHVMTISGYSDRGTDILGLNTRSSSIDQKPYTTLSYANGPGYHHHFTDERVDLSNIIFDKDTKYPATVPLKSETHGGDDVGVFALGPWAHLFTGVYEQNVIPHMMAFASCIGDGAKACDSSSPAKHKKKKL